MTRDEAQRECERLAAEHPDRASNTWRPREEADGGWSMVRISLGPPPDDRVHELRADEKPATPGDPRDSMPPQYGGA